MALLATLGVWWRLSRGEHALMSFLAIVASAIISTNSFYAKFLLFAAGPALIVLASFVFNDYCDLPSDRALKRNERPLVSKQVSPKTAFAVSAVLFVLGLLLCFFSSSLAFAIACAYSLLSIAYSVFLKKLPLVGNAVTATTYGISFFYGGAVALNSLDNFNLLVVSFAGFAFLAGLGRELLITLRDVQGDRKIGATTLPMVVGPMATTVLAALFFLAAVVATTLPVLNNFLAGTKLLVYVLFVGACDLALLYSAFLGWSSPTKENLSKARNYTLKAFQLALLGFFVISALSVA